MGRLLNLRPALITSLVAPSVVSDKYLAVHEGFAAACADEISRASLKHIERGMGRTVSIRPNAPTARLRLAVNRQRMSHFFKLPPELRICIYELVFRQRGDASRPYKTAAPYYRPGYEAHHVTETAFLLTCRRIWLEANHLPLELATQTFWFFSGPFDSQRLWESAVLFEATQVGEESPELQTPSEDERFQRFFQCLTPLNTTCINHVRIFASQPWLLPLVPVAEPFDHGLAQSLNERFGKGWFVARKVTITLRDSDWGSWKTLKPKHVSLGWLETLLSCPQLQGVQEFRLELEMKMIDHHLLQGIAKRVGKRKSSHFRLSGERKETTWSRPSLVGDREGTTYSVMTFDWQNIGSTAELRRHQSGANIVGGQLQDFRPSRRTTARFDKKRGGRRSQRRGYRNRWQPVNLPKGDVVTDAAAEIMATWEKEGSLLRIV